MAAGAGGLGRAGDWAGRAARRWQKAARTCAAGPRVAVAGSELWLGQEPVFCHRCPRWGSAPLPACGCELGPALLRGALLRAWASPEPAEEREDTGQGQRGAPPRCQQAQATPQGLHPRGGCGGGHRAPRCSLSTPPSAGASPAGPGQEQEEGQHARRRQGRADAKSWRGDGWGSRALPCSGAGRIEEEEEEGCCSWLAGGWMQQGLLLGPRQEEAQPPPTPCRGCLWRSEAGSSPAPRQALPGLRASEPAPSPDELAGAGAAVRWGREQKDGAVVLGEQSVKRAGLQAPVALPPCPHPQAAAPRPTPLHQAPAAKRVQPLAPTVGRGLAEEGACSRARPRAKGTPGEGPRQKQPEERCLQAQTRLRDMRALAGGGGEAGGGV